MTEKELELVGKIGEMEGDIKATVSVFTFVLKSLGINLNEFSKDDDSISDEDHAMQIKSKMPSILGGVTRSVMGGGLNGKTMSKLSELGPIMKKYQHLAPVINTENDGK
ncbi:MAG: hypothetical protein MK066_13530 [Crocinitomicaceae bacterium]|nr:hypothetical protein [Crocinitomicaceae bacterium]